PEPAAVVKRDVHRLVDVRLRGDKLNLETGRQPKPFALLVGRAGAPGSNMLRKKLVLVLRAAQAGDGDEPQHNSAFECETHCCTPGNEPKGGNSEGGSIPRGLLVSRNVNRC